MAMLVWQFSDPTGVLGSAVASVQVEKGQMRLRYAGQGDGTPGWNDASTSA